MRATTRKCSLKYRKQRQELINCTGFQSCRNFLHDQLAVTVIIDCETTESCKKKKKIGFTLHDVFNTKEQTTLALIKNTFEGGNMQTPTQYYV